MSGFSLRGWMEIEVVGERVVALVLPHQRSRFPDEWFVRSTGPALHRIGNLARAELLAICERLPGYLEKDSHRLSLQRLQNQVSDAISSRQMLVIAAPRQDWRQYTFSLLVDPKTALPATTSGSRAAGGSPTVKPPEVQPGAVAATPAATPLPTTFITIHLVDEDGNGIPQAACQVVVDDDRVIARRFDAKGMVDQHGLRATTCRFTLPDIHQSRWSTKSGGGSETVVSQPRADHAIGEGDSIAQVALPQGYTIAEVWDHAGNEALRERCGHPNQLAPGAVLTLPPWKGKELLLPTGMVHIFTLHQEPLTIVSVQVIDGDAACADQEWSFKVDGEAPLSGVCDGDGVVELSLPVTVQSGVLTIGKQSSPDEEQPKNANGFRLQIDHLQPISEITGVRQRLANLGFWWEIPDRSEDERLTAAVRSFQVRTGLDPSGSIDDQTRSKLVDLHDRRCPFPSEPAVTHKA